MAPTEKTPARTILSMAALRDHPTLPADLATYELPMPKTAGIEVTTLTLKKGVEVATVDPSMEAAAHEPELQSVPPTITLDRNTDLLVRLNRSELVELRPFKEGWYAELAVDAEAKSALDKFSTAVYSLGKAKHPQLAFASPFTEAGPKAAADGKVASVHAKVAAPCPPPSPPPAPRTPQPWHRGHGREHAQLRRRPCALTSRSRPSSERRRR